MGLYDASLGALLVGSWFNTMFYMLELYLAYTYFTTFKRDGIFIKAAVGFNVVMDTLGTANNCACIYLYTITHWGDLSYIINQNWAVPAYVILSGISAFTVQIFLVYRFWSLSKNWLVTPFLALCACSALAGAIANGITVTQNSAFADRRANIKTVIIWLVCSAATDILIALALVWKFQTTNTTFSQTKSLIQRLTYTAIQTGSVTTVIAVLCLILYLIDPEINITVGFGFCLGRIYSLTMLFNLNTRTRPRGVNDSSTGPNHSGHIHDNEYSLRQRTAQETGGISVHRTAIVRIDDQNYDYMDDAKNTHGDQKPPLAV
ncbi:hypothetical protein CYLTODRAFT_422967 [Cylindrobasidium torrendii FP15055 ss-10]|uniref:DUF6534 domain-containing protein n=1 Tax=Cylindrobasidium torrendii FP15055 ss-10 TaxID=1314674 RepID=A0A0D7B8R0_9AGAR|nr:hypothetical protein CYLTODRAFT_422967 [Cylindrobasidium torrendii FP15055 ss-10]